jgi:hypothetical protein
MAKKDDDLFARLRALGMRKGKARKVSRSLSGTRPTSKVARRAMGDLSAAVAEVQDRISGGPEKRKAAAKKAARTRAKKAGKRSESAKKAARTRARGR